MKKEPIDHVEGETKEEAIENLTDSMLLELFADFFPSVLDPLLRDKLRLEAIRKQDLGRALDLSTTSGSDGCGEWSKRVSTNIRTFGYTRDSIQHKGKTYENTESFHALGSLWTGRYKTQADKVIRHVLETLFPYLTEFKCQIFKMESYEKDPLIFVNCERQLYVPLYALVYQSPAAIIERSKWAAKTWPSAGIFSPEAEETHPDTKRFLELVAN